MYAFQKYFKIVFNYSISKLATTCCCRQFCGPNRIFKIQFSHRDKFSFDIKRKSTFCDNYLIFCGSFLHRIDVYSSDGLFLGYAKQTLVFKRYIRNFK